MKWWSERQEMDGALPDILWRSDGKTTIFQVKLRGNILTHGDRDQTIVYFDESVTLRHIAKSTRPPRSGEFILSVLVPIAQQEERLGDFNEAFDTRWVPMWGVKTARLLYLWHALLVGMKLAASAVVELALGWLARRFDGAA